MVLCKMSFELGHGKGSSILPLERDGLISIESLASDRRAKGPRLTKAGEKRLQAALRVWSRAQARFDAIFGIKRAADLRALLRSVVASEFTPVCNLGSLGRSARPMLEKSDYDRWGGGAVAWLAYTVVGSNCLTPVLSITNSGTARYISTSATKASQRLSRITQLPSRRAATTA